jgi:hypothetical protein
MARRYSSLGLFGIFGRSSDLRAFDQALRSVDVHPRMVPEAVKLTSVALLKDHAIEVDPTPQSYRAAAEIIGYCMIGPEGFAGANSEDLLQQVERRVEWALETGDNLDAKLVLLTLHAKIIQPSVVYRSNLASKRGSQLIRMLLEDIRFLFEARGRLHRDAFLSGNNMDM